VTTSAVSKFVPAPTNFWVGDKQKLSGLFPPNIKEVALFMLIVTPDIQEATLPGPE